MKTLFYILVFIFPLSALAKRFPDEPLRFSKQGPLNFGLLVNNSKHKIYRSERLGSSGLKELKEYLQKKRLPFPKTILHMNRHGFKKKFPFFERFAIEEFKLQKKYAFNFYHGFKYSYRTYLHGENPYEPDEDIDGTKYLGKDGRKYFGIIKDNKKDGGIDAFMRIMHLILKSDEPVLFHCTGGRHRTGIVAMAIRYLQGDQWIFGKKREVKVGFFGKKMRLNPAQYEYYLHNKRQFREENIRFIEEFYNDPLFGELEEAYQESLNL